MWDDEVDVVCCGAGIGALAAAIAATDAGHDVLVVRPGARPAVTGDGAGWLWAGIEDPATRDYFEALTAGLDAAAPAQRDADLPVRTVTEWSAPRRGARIEPFYGARLQDWAARCLTSPYGVVGTRLSDHGSRPVRSEVGEKLQARIIGGLDLAAGPDSLTRAVDGWLWGQARNRGIEVSDGPTLRRIVFEEGEIVGAELATADGPLRVRARHAVTVATGAGPAEPEPPGAPAGDAVGTHDGRALQVCLVGHSASRFARVELLTIESACDAPRSGYCQTELLSGGRREGRRSHARRGREMHRNPPRG
ncbi:FAD-binding protein [Mycobacterium sp. NPDC003449]